MKHLCILISALALTIAAFFPAAARADEDRDGLEGLDVTMFVLDDPLDFEESLNEMDGPGDDGVNDDDWNDHGEDESDDESGD